MTDEAPPSFPNYQPPQGLPVAHPKQAAVLMKQVSRMFKPKLKAPSRRKGKGLKSDQDVHITQKRVAYW